MLAFYANRVRVALLWWCPLLLACCMETLPAPPEADGEEASLPADSAAEPGSEDTVAAPPESPEVPPGDKPDPIPAGEDLLIGRVVDGGGRPIPGMVAELARLGRQDTTDAHGGFAFRVPAGAGRPQAKPGGDILDSLRIRRDDRILAQVGVAEYRDTLPDVEVIRLALAGRIAAAPRAGSRLHLELTAGSGDPVALPVQLDGTDLAWQSGFLLGAMDSGLDCRAVISALDEEGRLLGRSDTVAFRAEAGGAEIPAWDPGNALPTATATGPARVRAGDAVRLGAQVSDGLGGGIVRVEWDAGNRGVFSPAAGDGGFSAEAPALPADAWECVLKAVDDEGNETLDTVAVRIEPDPFADLRPFWGDVHAHSSFSLDFRRPDSAAAAACAGDPDCAGAAGADALFRNARREGLDFAMITDHAEDLTPAEWEATVQAVAGHDEPGRFVPFAGYEFCDSAGTEEACANVILPGKEGGPVFADPDFRRSEGGAAVLVEGLAGMRERLVSEAPDAFVFLPHPGDRQDWSALAGDGPVIGVEISSTGGGPTQPEARACRASVLEAFRRGLRLQVLGAGNDHHAGPGRASLTGVLAPELTREALVEAFRKRRTFATRGSRLVLSFDAEGHPMGEAVALAPSGEGNREIRLRASAISADASLQSIRIFRLLDGKVSEVEVLGGEGPSLVLEAVDSLPAGTGCLYWAEASLQGQNPDFGSEAWTTPVWVLVESASD